MHVRIRNCANDPRYHELREFGNPVNEPVLCGRALSPGHIRFFNKEELLSLDLDYLDYLVKNGSCEIFIPGKGVLPDVSYIKEVLGIKEEPPAELEAPFLEPPPEEIIVEDESAKEDEEADGTEDPKYTEEVLLSKKNAELRSIVKSLGDSLSTKNKSKKALVQMILENQ